MSCVLMNAASIIALNMPISPTGRRCVSTSGVRTWLRISSPSTPTRSFITARAVSPKSAWLITVTMRIGTRSMRRPCGMPRHIESTPPIFASWALVADVL